MARPDQVSSVLEDRWLSAAERERASRYRVRAAADGFTAARVLLHIAAASVGGVVAWSRHGAPRLEHAGDVFVSSSRTAGLVAVALGRGTRVGVDVERVQPGLAEGPLPALVLTAAEHDALEASGRSDREMMFLRLWTRKEAVAKAMGFGVGYRPQTIDAPWSCVGGVAHHPLGSHAVCDLALGAGVVGAVATRTPCDVRVRRFGASPPVLDSPRSQAARGLRRDPEMSV